MNSVRTPSRAWTSLMNFAASLVRSVKPRPGVCTVSSDDAMVVACTDDGAERVTDLFDVMKGLSIRKAAVGWAKRSVPTSPRNEVKVVGTALRTFAHPTTSRHVLRSSPRRPSARGWPCRSAGARPFPGTTSPDRRPGRWAAESRSCGPPRRPSAPFLSGSDFGSASSILPDTVGPAAICPFSFSTSAWSRPISASSAVRSSGTA